MTGTLVEAYLLTGAPYGEIGLRLGLSPPEIILYGRLFYDVRDGQGNRRPEILMRIKLELQQAPPTPANELKLIALTGTTMLDQMIGPAGQSPPTLFDLVDQELTRRVIAQQLRDGDLIRLQANGQIRLQMELEHNPPAKDQGGWDVVRRMMDGLKLEVKVPIRTPEQHAQTTQALRHHLEAQQRVAATEVPTNPDMDDRGVDDLLRQSFGRAK